MNILKTNKLRRVLLWLPIKLIWALVVPRLVEQPHPTPAVRGSNPVIGKVYIECLLLTVLENEKRKKRPVMTHFRIKVTNS